MTRILAARYVLAVPDAAATGQFFCDVLGFDLHRAQPPGWCFVERDGCVVMLGSCPDALHPSELGDHSYFAFIQVDDVDALHSELGSRGLHAPAPRTKPWGVREIVVSTPDGHRITFGQLVATNQGGVTGG